MQSDQTREPDARKIERSPKLTARQADLLNALKKGVRVFWLEPSCRNPTPYYFRADNQRQCSAAARKLLALGLVELHFHELRVKEGK